MNIPCVSKGLQCKYIYTLKILYTYKIYLYIQYHFCSSKNDLFQIFSIKKSKITRGQNSEGIAP